LPDVSETITFVSAAYPWAENGTLPAREWGWDAPPAECFVDNFDTDETAPVAHQMDFLFCHFDQKRSVTVVRAVVRGELPLADLAGAGISATNPAGCADRFAGLPVWSADLAAGIMNLKHDRSALADWAKFVVSAAEFFDYASHDVPCCQRLLSYIWQIPYGGGLSGRAITLATMVRNWPRRAA